MDWLNPLNRLEIQKAVRDGKTEVTLRNGHTMAIEYETDQDVVKNVMGSSYRTNDTLVKLSPIWPRGFAPRGQFSKKKIMSLEFSDAT